LKGFATRSTRPCSSSSSMQTCGAAAPSTGRRKWARTTSCRTRTLCRWGRDVRVWRGGGYCILGGEVGSCVFLGGGGGVSCGAKRGGITNNPVAWACVMSLGKDHVLQGEDIVQVRGSVRGANGYA
jgi:hypothetical protein